MQITETAEDESQDGGAPRHLLPMTILTGIYLIFELAFNARLLDVSGGLVTPEEIDSIEHYGRFISGIAFALLIWGMVLIPRGIAKKWRLPEWVLLLSLGAAVSIATVFVLEKKLIDHLTEQSSGQNRRIATQLTMLAHAILTQQVRIDGIDLSEKQLATPEGKSFIALFPVLAYSANKIDEKTEAVFRQIIRNSVVSSFGSEEDFYNKTYHESWKKMAQSYNSYVDGVQAMNNAKRQIPQRQAEAWQDYTESLARRNWRPDHIPAMAIGRVRRQVRGNGVPVPQDWAPSDRVTFYGAIRHRIEAEAEAGYRSKIRQLLGTDGNLPQNLTFPDFLAQSSIHRRWCEVLTLPGNCYLTANMTVAEYSRLYYEPKVSAIVNDQMQVYRAEEGSFRDGGANAGAGMSAMRALLVPPIALGFSLLGGLLHMAKFSLFSARFVSSNKRLTRSVVLGGLGVLMLSAFAATNPVTSSRVFGYFQTQSRTHLGWLPERALTWVVQAQPYAYPVNEWVRTQGLFGITYGYHPELNESQRIMGSKGQ